MKTIKTFIVAIAMFAMAAPAFADQQMIDSLIGAVVGGGAGRYACRNCNTKSKNIATAVTGLAGAWVGGKVGDDSGTRFQAQQDQREDHFQQQQYQQRQIVMANQNRGGYAGSVDNSRAVNTVDVSQDNGGWAPVPEAARRPVRFVEAPRDVVVERAPVRHAPVAAGCDREEYYHGQFNPEAARAFCIGREEARARRVQQIRDAYQEGLAAANDGE